MGQRVDIVLPGLCDLPLEELDSALLSNRLPGLNRILRLATPRRNSAFSIDAILRQVVGLDDGTVSCLPLAQAWIGDSSLQADRLLLFQAVHLRADMQSAVLMPIENNEGNRADINKLINDLSDLFKVDCDISSVTESLYLMHLKALDAPTHYPHILSVLGRTVNPYIEQTRQNLTWYRLVNEMQMFLHQHDVNRERIERGLLPINSLWFWGGGETPAAKDIALDWYGDDALLNRFVEGLGLQAVALERLPHSSPARSAVVVDLRLLEMLKAGVSGELEALLLDIDERLLRPLLATVSKRRWPLSLRAGYEYDFYLPPTARWKFWRRPRSLADWAKAEEDL